MANLKRRIPNELPPPATAPLPNDAPEWVALGSRRRALVDRVAAGEDVYLVEPTGSRTDTGGWFGQRRVWLAAGHGMLGISMSSGSGQLIADLICQRPAAVDPQAYRPERFA